jgi:hypothetical protein
MEEEDADRLLNVVYFNIIKDTNYYPDGLINNIIGIYRNKSVTYKLFPAWLLIV